MHGHLLSAMLRLFVFGMFLGIFTGCDRPKPPLPSVQTHSLSSAPGFVEWADAQAKVFVIRTFDRDTNRDGKVEGRAGEHGEVEGDVPTLHIVNRDGSAVLHADELLATDLNARFFVAKRGDEGLLFDSQTQDAKPLVDMDVSHDGNPCMKHRSAAFDISGRWLGWITKDQKYRVRDLRTGAEQTFQPPGKLWRAEPVPNGWVAMKIVEDEASFPRAKTTCACSWCPRFARSIGNYGWVGESKAYLVSATEALELTAAWLPLSSSVLLDAQTSTLKDKSTPSGCKISAYALGASSVVLSCGDHLELWNPATGFRSPLDGVQLQGPQKLASWSRAPISFVSLSHEGVLHMATLNWESGAITRGPIVRNLVGTTGEWAVGQNADRVVYFSVDGREHTYQGTAKEAEAAFVADGEHGVNLENGHSAPRSVGELIAGPCAVTSGFKHMAPPTIVCVE